MQSQLSRAVKLSFPAHNLGVHPGSSAPRDVHADGKKQFFPLKTTSKAGGRGWPLPGRMAACVHMPGFGGWGGAVIIRDAFCQAR